MTSSLTAQRARPKRLIAEFLSIAVVDAEPGGLRFSIPRRLGTAVARNRLKRQLREIVRRNPPPAGRLVTIGVLNMGGEFQKLEEEYLKLMEELGLRSG